MSKSIMTIKGQGNSLTLVEAHSDSAYSNFFFLETARPIEAKFQEESPWENKYPVCKVF